MAGKECDLELRSLKLKCVGDSTRAHHIYLKHSTIQLEVDKLTTFHDSKARNLSQAWNGSFKPLLAQRGRVCLPLALPQRRAFFGIGNSSLIEVDAV